MAKRGIDAESRIFLPSLGVSRLRATGAIRLEDRQVIFPFGGRMKLIGVAHTVFRNGGSWSYFRCPKCGGRKKKLWLVDDAPRCRLCLEKLGVRYRSAYAFGQSERLRERDRRVDRLQAMLEGGPLRLKPVPANWGNRRLDGRIRLTWALLRSSVQWLTKIVRFVGPIVGPARRRGPGEEFNAWARSRPAAAHKFRRSMAGPYAAYSSERQAGPPARAPL
jgi:hypothetical protein